MQTISGGLETTLNSSSQVVDPVVIATFADSKHTTNLRAFSDSEAWFRAIDRRNPILFWKYDNLTYLTDHSTNGISGTISGSPTLGVGPIGYTDDGCYVVTPNASGCYCAHNDLLRPASTGFTLGAWVKITTKTTSESWIAVKRNLTTYTASSVEYGIVEVGDGTTNNFRAFCSNGSTIYTIDALSALSTNTWYFVALTISDTSVKFYINGVLQGSTTMSSTARQGSDYFRTAANMTGSIDEVVALNTALTVEELLALYHSAVATESEQYDKYFAPIQAFNGIKEETLPILHTDGTDNYNKPAKANGAWYALSKDIDHTKTEVGWRSRGLSDGSGVFAYAESVTARFDTRKANKLTVYSSYTFGRIKSYELYYFNTSGVKVSVGTFTLPQDLSFQSHSLGGTYDVTGAQIKVLSTWNPANHAIVHELDVLYEVDVSSDIVSLSLTKSRETYEDTLPIGHNESNNISLVFNNVDGKYTPGGSGAYSPYIGVDTQFDISLKWETDADIVKQGVFYADSWNFGSDEMTISADCRDYSRKFDENIMEQGIFFQNVTVGTAITTLAKMAGVPNRKALWYHNSYNEIKRDNPTMFLTLADSFEEYETGDTYAGFVYNDEFNTHDGTTLLTGVSPGGDNIITSQEERSLSASAIFSGTVADSYISVAHHADFLMSSAWTIECFIKPTSLTYDTTIIAKKTDAGGADTNFDLQLLSTGSLVLKTANSSSGAISTVSSGAGTVVVDQVYHVMASFDGATQKLNLWVNGTQYQTSTGFATCKTNTANIGIGSYTYAVANDQFVGLMENVAIFDRALSNTDVQRHYTASKFVNLSKYPFLYGIDQTYLDLMLEWSTADVGVFFFDELENFFYEYHNTLHTSSISKYATSQYSFSDSTNIISGSQNLELQANKVKVEVNPITTINSARQGIWRAEDNESLAVCGLVGTVSLDATTINVSSTQYPPWKKEGYLKIDDEIMSYSGTTPRSFLNVKRGLFETTQSAHTGDSSWSFNTGTEDWNAGSDWTNSNCSIKWKADTFRTVAGSIMARSKIEDAETEMGPSSPRGTQGAEVQVGKSYTASIYTKAATTSRTVKCRLIWYNSSGEYISHNDGTGGANNTSTWTQRTVTATAPAGAKFASVRAVFLNTVAGEKHFIDDVTLPGTRGKVREVRVYDIKFDNSPCIGIKRPLITALTFDKTAAIDEFTHDHFGAHVVVSATKFAKIRSIVLLEGTDPITELNYYFAISGIPLIEKTDGSGDVVETASAEIADNERRYGIKELVISNKFIQSKEYAQSIADWLITHYRNPIPIINLSTTGVPHIQLGDRITVVNFNQFSMTNSEFWVMSSNIEYDGGINQTFTLRKVS